MLVETPLARPYRTAIVAIGEAAHDINGLSSADFDLLARLPDLESLEILATEGQLATGLLERLHGLLPELEEVRVPVGDSPVEPPTPRRAVRAARRCASPAAIAKTSCPTSCAGSARFIACIPTFRSIARRSSSGDPFRTSISPARCSRRAAFPCSCAMRCRSPPSPSPRRSISSSPPWRRGSAPRRSSALLRSPHLQVRRVRRPRVRPRRRGPRGRPERVRSRRRRRTTRGAGGRMAVRSAGAAARPAMGQGRRGPRRERQPHASFGRCCRSPTSVPPVRRSTCCAVFLDEFEVPIAGDDPLAERLYARAHGCPVDSRRAGGGPSASSRPPLDHRRAVGHGAARAWRARRSRRSAGTRGRAARGRRRRAVRRFRRACTLSASLTANGPHAVVATSSTRTRS